MKRWSAHASIFVSVMGLLYAARAEAKTKSFLTMRDNGTLAAKKLENPAVITDFIMTAYDKTKTPRPDVISLWTSFPMNNNVVETLYDPIGQDVTGIGLEHTYGGDGTIEFDYPPTHAILLHNDFTAMAKRAKSQAAPEEGLARYLFLLELSHLWGPAVRIPATDGGAPPDALIGFLSHWSFWMDAGGSPAGGNIWKDNGNGTFTVSGQTPKTIAYSMLDLYLMGLADPSEVPPFGVLENAVAPADATDPFTGRALSGQSFPWFRPTPLTVTATRRTITIDQIIAANGARNPARSSGSLKLGIVMVVPQSATDEDVARLEASFEPLAASLAPAFHEATHERGTMTVVTASEVPGTEEPPPQEEIDAGVEVAKPAEPPPQDSSGCEVTRSTHGSGAIAALLGVALFAFARLRRRGVTLRDT